MDNINMVDQSNQNDRRGKAVQILTQWLSHENELGKEPHAIEVADEFEYESMHAYIIKYKKGILSKWWLGVCVLDEAGDDCGLTFSNFEPYNPDTAKGQCIQMIQYLQEYWKNRMRAQLEYYGVTEEEFNNMSEEEWKQKVDEVDNQNRSAVHSILLLDKAEFDFDRLIADLKKEWNLELGESSVDENGNLVFKDENNIIGLSLISAPVPDEEAEYAAQTNYMWQDAVATVKKHTAHIIVFAINHDNSSIEASLLLSMLVSACLNQKNVIGIYTVRTVFEPAFYKAAADVIKQGQLPIHIWVYFGFGKSQEGNDGYTYGLDRFNLSDMEIINSSHSFEEIKKFLFMVCHYIISEGMRFYDGETLAFTSDEEYTITKSPAVYLKDDSFKINY